MLGNRAACVPCALALHFCREQGTCTRGADVPAGLSRPQPEASGRSLQVPVCCAFGHASNIADSNVRASSRRSRSSVALRIWVGEVGSSEITTHWQSTILDGGAAGRPFEWNPAPRDLWAAFLRDSQRRGVSEQKHFAANHVEKGRVAWHATCSTGAHTVIGTRIPAHLALRFRDRRNSQGRRLLQLAPVDWPGQRARGASRRACHAARHHDDVPRRHS